MLEQFPGFVLHVYMRVCACGMTKTLLPSLTLTRVDVM